MIAGLLWIFGCYGLGIAVVHWMYFRQLRRHGRKVNYILTTKDNELHIEWYLRSLSFFSWLKGKEIAVYVLDEGSTDETLKIIHRLAGKGHTDLVVLPPGVTLDDFLHQHENDSLVMVKLNNQEGRLHLPLML